MSTSFQEFFERLQKYTPIQNQSQLAQALEVGRAAITLAKRKEIIPSKWILYLAQKYSLNSDWLASGQGQPYPVSEAKEKENQFGFIPIVTPQVNKEGQFVLPHSLKWAPFQFNQVWLANIGDPQSVVCMRMVGNSMEPEIKDGDYLLIDRSLTNIYAGHVYALGIEETVVIRRVERLPRKMLLHCDNDKYSTLTISGQDRLNIQTLGRLVWVGRDFI